MDERPNKTKATWKPYRSESASRGEWRSGAGVSGGESTEEARIKRKLGIRIVSDSCLAITDLTQYASAQGLEIVSLRAAALDVH